MSAPARVEPVAMPRQQAGLLMTVEEVALLWFGVVGDHGSASANCQKIRRLIPDVLPARRIGNRWYVSRSAAEAWAAASDPASVMAHPDSREAMQRAGEA
jgi:hypothetical protein